MEIVQVTMQEWSNLFQPKVSHLNKSGIANFLITPNELALQEIECTKIWTLTENNRIFPGSCLFGNTLGSPVKGFIRTAIRWIAPNVVYELVKESEDEPVKQPVEHTTQKKFTNVFKAGDTVYHAEYGKVKVTSVSEKSVLFKHEKNTVSTNKISLLSFSPWPAPDHERKVVAPENGWWIVKYREKDLYLRYIENGVVKIEKDGDSLTYSLTSELEHYEFIKFLGEEIV